MKIIDNTGQKFGHPYTLGTY